MKIRRGERFRESGVARFLLVTVVGIVLLLSACGSGDPVDLVSSRYRHSFETVRDLTVDPSGDTVALFGMLAASSTGVPEYGLELISLGDGTRLMVTGLPTGPVLAADWTPAGDGLVVVMGAALSAESAVNGICGDRSTLAFISHDGHFTGALALPMPLDLGGGIAVLRDPRWAVASVMTPGSCEHADRRLVLIDLESGAIDELGDLHGYSPVRAAGGVVFIEDRRVRWFDPDTGLVRDVPTPGLRVLSVAGSEAPELVFRGYEEYPGENVGLYSIDLNVGSESIEFIMPTALNRLSLDRSGSVLVGLRPNSGGSSYVAVTRLSPGPSAFSIEFFDESTPGITHAGFLSQPSVSDAFAEEPLLVLDARDLQSWGPDVSDPGHSRGSIHNLDLPDVDAIRDLDTPEFPFGPIFRVSAGDRVFWGWVVFGITAVQAESPSLRISGQEIRFHSDGAVMSGRDLGEALQMLWRRGR